MQSRDHREDLSDSGQSDASARYAIETASLPSPRSTGIEQFARDHSTVAAIHRDEISRLQRSIDSTEFHQVRARRYQQEEDVFPFE